MGLYEKIGKAAGKKTAASVLKIFIFLKNIPSEIKRFFKIISNRIKKLFLKESRIFLIATPDYGNMGDQLIALSEILWLKNFYPDTQVIPCSQADLLKDKKLRLFLSRVKKNDLLFFQGGGNLNNLYLQGEGIRRIVLKKCPQNKIVLFQQSINLYPPVDGISIKAETENIYNAHKNFIVITREETSYHNALESFPELKVLKYPDMATYLFGKIEPSQTAEREGVVFCIRNDKEKFYSDEKINDMVKNIGTDYNIAFKDTHIGHTVSEKTRQAEVQKLIDSFSVHKVMVTDRFHGVVFSILSKTPCVVLRSADHKITDGVKWFKDADGIFFADDISQVPDLVKKAEKYSPLTQPDFSHYFEQMYNDITKKP